MDNRSEFNAQVEEISEKKDSPGDLENDSLEEGDKKKIFCKKKKSLFKVINL